MVLLREYTVNKSKLRGFGVNEIVHLGVERATLHLSTCLLFNKGRIGPFWFQGICRFTKNGRSK